MNCNVKPPYRPLVGGNRNISAAGGVVGHIRHSSDVTLVPFLSFFLCLVVQRPSSPRAAVVDPCRLDSTAGAER